MTLLVRQGEDCPAHLLFKGQRYKGWAVPFSVSYTALLNARPHLFLKLDWQQSGLWIQGRGIPSTVSIRTSPETVPWQGGQAHLQAIKIDSHVCLLFSIRLWINIAFRIKGCSSGKGSEKKKTAITSFTRHQNLTPNGKQNHVKPQPRTI